MAPSCWTTDARRPRPAAFRNDREPALAGHLTLPTGVVMAPAGPGRRGEIEPQAGLVRAGRAAAHIGRPRGEVYRVERAALAREASW
jgi:hypothetical protein